MGFLHELKEDFITNMLFEELSDEPPKKISRIIATLSGKDEFLFTFYSEHVLWEERPGLGTAGVRPYGDGQHVVFTYDPAWFLGLEKSMIYFLLGHEVYHILRDHHEREADKGGKDHSLANICMDVWINTDLYSEGSLGGFAMKPPFKVFGFRSPDDWGDVEAWVNETVEKATGTRPNPEEKYEGVKMWEPLYDWVKEMHDKYGINPDDDSENPQPPGPPTIPQPGQIIRGPGGEFGQVISVDEGKGVVTEIEPLTKEEAHKRVRAMA